MVAMAGSAATPAPLTVLGAAAMHESAASAQKNRATAQAWGARRRCSVARRIESDATVQGPYTSAGHQGESLNAAPGAAACRMMSWVSKHPRMLDGNDDRTRPCQGVVQGLVAVELPRSRLHFVHRAPAVAGRADRRGPQVHDGRRQFHGVGIFLQQLRQFDVRFPAPLQDVEVRSREWFLPERGAVAVPLVGGTVTVPLFRDGCVRLVVLLSRHSVRPEVVVPVIHVVPTVDDVQWWWQWRLRQWAAVEVCGAMLGGHAGKRRV